MKRHTGSRRPTTNHPAPTVVKAAVETPFAEADTWAGVGAGWHPLFGRHRDLGFSFEWHDFESATPLDWGRSFHPGGIELCLNLEGMGTIQDTGETLELAPRTWTLYRQGEPPLRALRAAGNRHRFLTVEFTRAFLMGLLSAKTEDLHPLVKRVIEDDPPASQVASVEHLGGVLLQLVDSLRNCPVFLPAREAWFRSKALELASHLLFRPAEGEFFCTRAQRAGRERVDRARAILRERMQEAPTLEELGRLVGCSPFYLSRLFSQETGQTLQQYLRQIRLERAAELLRTGRCNVTEAAFEVGYNSLSHFSTAFREMFRCCPGLYPIRTVPPIASKPNGDGTRPPAG